MIYLDSSALLKLLHEEPESAALQDWLTAGAGIPLVVSDLAPVEVLRACRRIEPATVDAARALLRQLDLIPLTEAVLEDAGAIGDPLLRTPDAIHLASALSIQADLTAFVTYDRRLFAAAGTAGLAAVQPGSETA